MDIMDNKDKVFIAKFIYNCVRYTIMFAIPSVLIGILSQLIHYFLPGHHEHDFDRYVNDFFSFSFGVFCLLIGMSILYMIYKWVIMIYKWVMKWKDYDKTHK